jgi:hypothetical protein
MARAPVFEVDHPFTEELIPGRAAFVYEEAYA